MEDNSKQEISNLEMINLYIKEYGMQRDETLLCLKNANFYSTVTLAFLTWFITIFYYYNSFDMKENGIVSMVLFSVLIPLSSLTLFSLYFREIIKTMKVGRHQRELEAKIHLSFEKAGITSKDDHPFQWETEYVEKNMHSFISPLLILLMYVITGIVSLLYSLIISEFDIRNIIIILIVLLIVFYTGYHFILIIKKEFEIIGRSFPSGKVKSQHRKK